MSEQQRFSFVMAWGCSHCQDVGEEERHTCGWVQLLVFPGDCGSGAGELSRLVAVAAGSDLVAAKGGPPGSSPGGPRDHATEPRDSVKASDAD